MSSQLRSPGEALAFAKASAEGYSQGIAAARRAAAEKAIAADAVRESILAGIQVSADAQHESLRLLMAALQGAQIPAVEEAVRITLAAAMSIAESIVQVSLTDEKTRALSVAARAGALQGRGALTLRVCPQDFQNVQELLPEVTVLADAALGAGDFRACYPQGWIDGILAGAVDRARTETERQLNAL